MTTEPCPPPGPMPRPNLTGPDVPGIQCWIPTDCCAPSPCAIKEPDFLCAVRSLLPEGEVYNNTLITIKEQPVVIGVITVGCAKVGCEQLIFGGCCDEQIFCDDEPIAPQLAVVDSFAASAYKIIPALCELLREFDPCSAQRSARRWAERLGIGHPDPCGGKWSDETLAFLLCIMPQIRHHVINWEYLTELAGMFGARLEMYKPGDFNCGRDKGGWTMARDQAQCPPVEACRDEPAADAFDREIRLRPTCEEKPESLNIITCPSDIVIPLNCNLPAAWSPRPHDSERYQAFKWLLPQILPQPALYCVSECGEAEDCEETT